MKIINRIKAFLWIFVLMILSFIGIFIPFVHKCLNEGTLETAKKIIKKYNKKSK